MNTKNVRLLLVISLIALAFGLGTIASQFLPPGFLDNLSLSSMFLPIIQKAPGVPNNPSGSLYVFGTIELISPFELGRSGMNAICAAEDPASHFCSLEEIENAFQTTGVFFGASFNEGAAWLDNPLIAGSYWEDATYNCDGWISEGPGDDGGIISRVAYGYGYASCANNLRVACCKWVP